MASNATASPRVLSDTAAEGEHGESHHAVFNAGILIIFAMLMIYMLFEAYKHKKDIKFGHEASLVCLVGLAVSAIMWFQEIEEFSTMLEFNDDLFFYFVLPPIVFASGFNMYRRKFFGNIQNIVLFGVVSTLLTFSFFSLFTWIFTNKLELWQYQYDPVTDGWIQSQIKLQTTEILLMCSLLCSTDVVAAVSLIKPKKQPKLFSLVFGEGILNDAVCIILFNTVKDFSDSGEALTAGSACMIGVDFVVLGLLSLLLGLAFGLACSYLFKKARSLTKNPVAEICMIFSFAYLAYVVAELCHVSGIISLLTCGVTMAHYCWYSMSVQGQTNSNVVFQFLGFIAEAFVFSYLGLTFFSYRYLPFSTSLITIELLVLMFCRALSSMGLVGLLKLCGYEKDHPHPLTWNELLFIWYAGLIRGAIAFGLVLRIDHSNINRDLIVTTCLSLVLISTIVFGSTVGLLGVCLFPKKKSSEEEEDQEDEDLNQETVFEGSDSSSSQRSLLQHPNLEAEDHSVSQMQTNKNSSVVQPHSTGHSKRKVQKIGCCSKYFTRLDEAILKPMFIYKYKPFKAQQSLNFLNAYMEEGETAENVYKKAKTKILKGKEYQPAVNS